MTRRLLSLWNSIPFAWRFALAGWLVARVVLFLWSFVVYWMFPVALQNLDLFGEPVLTIFNLRTSERSAYSRIVEGTLLSFRAIDDQFMVDEQTGSIWSIQNGRGIHGSFEGESLEPAKYTVEKIFPYLGVKPAENIFLSLWQRFDTLWYLKIAEKGYQPDGSTVYFPAYPALIKALSSIMDPMFAGLLISNISLIGVLGYLYQMTATLMSEADARRTILCLLLFPTAFFLTSAYSESLFLFFVLASLFSGMRRRWHWSIFWGMLASLTRLQGVLLVLPLAWLVWRENDGIRASKKLWRFASLILIPLTTASFLAFTNLSLISTYEGVLNAQFVTPWANIFTAVSVLLSGNGSMIDLLNLIVTLGLFVMMIPVWKKLPTEYFLYSLAMLIAPLLRMTTTQPLVSMMRYALVIFPVFMVFGSWGSEKWLKRVMIYSFIFLQLYLSAQFILWGWVG